MLEKLEVTERQDLAHEVGRLRSGCLLAAWAMMAMNEGVAPPETESLRFEVYEGMGYVLEILARELGAVYGRLNEEKTAVSG
jgi:hypothetical protein